MLYIIGICCILAFILHGIDRRRTYYGRSPLSLGLLIPAAILGSLGSLCGMLFFSNRLSSVVLWILSILMLIATALSAWFFDWVYLG